MGEVPYFLKYSEAHSSLICSLIELYCAGFYIATVFSDNHFATEFVCNFSFTCNHFKRFLVFLKCFGSFIDLKKKVPYCFLDLRSYFSLVSFLRIPYF